MNDAKRKGSICCTKRYAQERFQVKVMTDVLCPFSSATSRPLYASGVFICLFDILRSPSSI